LKAKFMILTIKLLVHILLAVTFRDTACLHENKQKCYGLEKEAKTFIKELKEV
jgi:hypothetical protein